MVTRVVPNDISRLSNPGNPGNINIKPGKLKY